MATIGGHRPVGLIFAFAALLTPVIPVIKGLGLTPLALLCAVVGLAVIWRGNSEPAEPNRTLTAIILVLCVWALVSSFWSLDITAGVEQTLRFAGMMLTGYVLIRLAKSASGDDRMLCAKVLVISYLTVTIFLWTEIGLGGPFSSWWFTGVSPGSPSGYFWFNSAGSILAILAWPSALFVLRLQKKYLAFAVIGAAFITTYLIDTKSAVLAVVFGLVVACFVYALQTRATKFMGIVLAATVLVSPLIPLNVLQPKTIGLMGDSRPLALLHRLYIWDFAAKHILEKPILGWGMDASRRMPGGSEWAVDERYGAVGQAMPLHPHNTSLQLWMELGVVGAALGAAFLFVLFRALGAATTNRLTLALWSGQATTIITVAHLSFGAWQSWWLSAVFLSTAFALMAARENELKIPDSVL